MARCNHIFVSIPTVGRGISAEFNELYSGPLSILSGRLIRKLGFVKRYTEIFLTCIFNTPATIPKSVGHVIEEFL